MNSTASNTAFRTDGNQTSADIKRIGLKRLRVFATAIVLLPLTAACQSDCNCEPTTTNTEPGGPAISIVMPEESSEWKQVPTGGDTRCALGSPYSLWSRQADPKKILLILEGGGACWDRSSCDPDISPSYDFDAGEDESPDARNGIMNLVHPDNPVSDYSVVFAPTCTGDVLLGNSVVTYAPLEGAKMAEPLVVNHVGQINTEAVLQWIYQQYPNPETVFVVGWSAGAIPSPMVAAQVAEHYPNSRVAQFADGAGAYHAGSARLQPLFESWDTEKVLANRGGYENFNAGNFSFEDLYIEESKRHPNLVFHQYNSYEDEIGRRFMTLLGIPEGEHVTPYREQGHKYIRDNIENFRTYTAGGQRENIIGGYYDGILSRNNVRKGKPLALDRFYHYRIDDLSFRDWFASIALGEPVADMHCTQCDMPEYVLPTDR